MGSIATRFAAKQRTGVMPPAGSHRRTAGYRAVNSFGLAQEALLTERVAAQRAALKGVYLGNCNLTACQEPGAVWWNTGTRRWYCRRCANAINAPGWPLGDKTPIICFDRGIYATNQPRLLPDEDGGVYEAGE